MTAITQAIHTRYMGPTNTKGGRIKATAWAGSVTVPYDHALNVEDNHRAAAGALLAEPQALTTTQAIGANDMSSNVHQYKYDIKTKVSAWYDSAPYATREKAEEARRQSLRSGLEVSPVYAVKKA